MSDHKKMISGLSEESINSDITFAKGSGCYLTDIDGKEYLDFGSGIMTQALGHCHPAVIEDLVEQAKKLWNIHDLHHNEKFELFETLKSFIPKDMQFYSLFSTGAESIEGGLRTILSYLKSIGSHQNKIGALRYGFHGKTQGVRSLVHWDVGNLNIPSPSILGYSANCYRCPFKMKYPSCDLLCAELTIKHVISKPNVSSIIFEPIQAASGVIVPPKEYWQILQEACSKHGVIMFADEISTGGGRTGTFFASQHYGINPDIIAFAKGISNGFPFAILCGKKEIMLNKELGNAGGTSSAFGGNPLGCKVATSTITTIKNDKVIENVNKQQNHIQDLLNQLKDKFSNVIGDVRGIGLLWGVELVKCPTSKEPDGTLARDIFKKALEKGLRVILGGNTIRLAPPLIISQEEITEGIKRFDSAIEETLKERGM